MQPMRARTYRSWHHTKWCHTLCTHGPPWHTNDAMAQTRAFPLTTHTKHPTAPPLILRMSSSASSMLMGMPSRSNRSTSCTTLMRPVDSRSTLHGQPSAKPSSSAKYIVLTLHRQRHTSTHAHRGARQAAPPEAHAALRPAQEGPRGDTHRTELGPPIHLFPGPSEMTTI